MRLTILLILLVASSGCRNMAGPCAARDKPAPTAGMPLDEQERRGRDKYTVPSDDFRIGPPTGIDRSGPTGR